MMGKLLDDDIRNDALPLVSIVIPSYNCAQYLPECIDSCLAQTYPNIEIIVVDDGSTDNTKTVLQPYLGKVVYFFQENGGLAEARNTGQRIARGEYIAWLDADDIAHPERIMVQALYLEEHPATVLVCSNFFAFDETGEEYEEYCVQYYSQLDVSGGVGGLLSKESGGVAVAGASANVFAGNGRYTLIWGNFIHPPTVMIRAEGCRKAGNLNNNIPTQEDWEYFFRVSKFGGIAWVDYPLLRYRLHSQQMSSTANAVKNATGIVRVFESMLKEEHEYASDNKLEIRKMLGRFCASAVYTLLEDRQKTAAMGYLKKCFLCSPFSVRNYKLLAKLVLS